MIRRISALLLGLCLTVGSASALTVEQARELLEEKYVAEIPEEILALPTVEEIVAALGDPYTRYLTPEAYQDFLGTMNDTHTVGVGVAVSMTEAGLTIAQVLPGSPASEAGLEADAVILEIDGHSISPEMSIEDVAVWLTGKEGTEVTLAVLRPDGTQESYTMTRRAVTAPHTTYELWEDHIGYLDCRAFGTETPGHFSDAMEEYSGQVSKWIVDLRSNAGGALQEANDTVGLFLGRRVTGYLQSGEGVVIASAPRTGVESATLYPAIVLVSENTASAAEMFSGAIHSGQGGLLVGTRTFGKGLAQEMLDQERYPDYFPDGDAMTISSMRFYTAGGTATDQMGVLPHLVVEAEYAEPIARLLCAETPDNGNEGYLRLHLGGWRWYLDLERAAEDLPAFTALLEAIPPNSDLYQGQGGGEWTQVTVAELAEAYAPDFISRVLADAEGSDYQEAIDTLAVYGLLHGDETGNFHPEEALTRAQLCTMLAYAMNLRLTEGESVFPDVPADAWYAQPVNALFRLGMVSGFEDGSFRPEDPVTQEQLALILARAAAWMNVDFGKIYQAGPTEEALADPGLAAYSDWAKEGAFLMGRSMVTIFGDYVSMMHDDVANLDPQAPATRGEAAMCLYLVLYYCGVI